MEMFLLFGKPIAIYRIAMITPAQIRAARTLVGWQQSDLAAAAGVSIATIKNVERGASDPRLSTVNAIERALLASGIIFIDPDGQGGVGVRLNK
jgi:predicted transcriptional regulator